MIYFGRSFNLPDGAIVLPCDFCGNPCFEPDKHSCSGLMSSLLERMEDEA